MGRLINVNPGPGIVRDTTAFSSEGTWYDTDGVRFKSGYPEKIGGWVKATLTAFLGICRSLHSWVNLFGSRLTGIGTHLKFYIEDGGAITDVTPIRKTTNPLPNNPITSTIGSGIVTINDNGHGAIQGDYVTISGATAFNGLTVGQLNQEFSILTIVDANNYTVQTGGTASGSGAGGGAAVVATYQINIGLADFVLGTGWGTGTWGRGTWGSAVDTGGVGLQLRLWSQDNWGEDLLINPRNGAIYFCDAGGTPYPRGVEIGTQVGASDTPDVCLEILASPNERIVFALGVNPIGSAILDPLLVRWSDYEDYLDWTPSPTNGSGFIRLSSGSTIITGIKTTREILVWTDTSLWTFSFVGGTDIYLVDIADPNVDIVGPKARCTLSGVAYWMGRNNFYMYDGRTSVIPCAIRDLVFRDINRDQIWKVQAGSNNLFNEIIFLYPTADSNENNRYVLYNIIDGSFSFGTVIQRSAWHDSGLAAYPRGASTDGFLYFHEFGLDDGSTNPVTAINSYVETAPFELGGGEGMGKGDEFMFLNRCIPDITFRDSSVISPSVTYTFKRKEYPGAVLTTNETGTVTKTGTVNEYTKKLSIRLRGRAASFRVGSSDVGVDWRLGNTRLEVRTDGRKAS